MSWSQGSGGGWAPQGPGGAWGRPPGAPPQPGWGAAPQGAGPAASGPSPIGFDLQPGEVLFFFQAHGTTQGQVLGWIFGILLLPLLVGFVILYFVTRGGHRPGAYAVTSQRVVSIAPKNGWVQSYWLSGVVDLEPIRQSVHVHGGGLVGVLVGAAVSAGMNALADRKQKLDRGYWQRATGVTLIGADGQKQVIDLAQGHGPIIGVTVAQLLAGQHHALRPLDPASFAGALAPSKPMAGALQRIVAVCLFPIGCLLLAEATRSWSASDVSGMATWLVAGLVVAGLGLGLFVWGTLAARAANLAETPVPPPAMPGAPPAPAPAPKAWKGGDLAWTAVFGLVAVTFLWLLGDQAANALTQDARPSTRPARGSSAPTAARAAPGAPASLPGPSAPLPHAGLLGFERVDGILRSQGSTYTSPPERTTMGPAAHATFNTNQGPWLALWDFTCAAPPSSGAVACQAGPRHGVAIELSRPGTPARDPQLTSEARALAQAIGTSTASAAGLGATLQRLGWRTSSPITDDSYTFAHRTYLIFADKGPTSATIHVADYARAAQKMDGATVRVVGAQVLLVSAQYGGGAPAAEALAAKIAGR